MNRLDVILRHPGNVPTGPILSFLLDFRNGVARTTANSNIVARLAVRLTKDQDLQGNRLEPGSRLDGGRCNAGEQIGASGYGERDRARTGEVQGQRVSSCDVPEMARLIIRMAEACAGLVGGAEAKPAGVPARRALSWYGQHAVPVIRNAMQARRQVG